MPKARAVFLLAAALLLTLLYGTFAAAVSAGHDGTIDRSVSSALPCGTGPVADGKPWMAEWNAQSRITTDLRTNGAAERPGVVLMGFSPEPGSFVAFFSGIVGLVGFAFRRRTSLRNSRNSKA